MTISAKDFAAVLDRETPTLDALALRVDGFTNPAPAMRMRDGLVWLIHHAMFEPGMTNGQRLSIAAALSDPKWQRRPREAVEHFTALAEERGVMFPVAMIYTLAADAFQHAIVTSVEDEPLTQDGAEEGIVRGRVA